MRHDNITSEIPLAKKGWDMERIVRQVLQGDESMKATCEHKGREAATKDGLCNTCRMRKVRQKIYDDEKQYKEYLGKRKGEYQKNPEAFRKRMRKYYEKKRKEDPEWNAIRQRKFRAKYPEKHNYIMARWYFKKLTLEQKKKLLEEAHYGHQ
jgi:hypothetical protein